MAEAFETQGEKLIRRISKLKAVKVFDLFDIEALWNELALGDIILEKGEYWITLSIEKGLAAAEEITSIPLAVDMASSPMIRDARNDILGKLKSLTDRTSIENLRGLITDSFTSNDTVQDLTKKIRAEFDQYSKVRAEMIARTESSNAYGRASLEYYREAGIKYKRWQTMEDDRVSDICWANQNAGTISMDALFPSGNLNEPSHPNCRCSMVPVSGE
jgi:SPP1 gp7 family putative phage head morphogenesis protein